MKGLSIQQIKIGDYLVRKNDALQREDSRLRVLRKRTSGKVAFLLEGWTSFRYGGEISSLGYSIVERDGAEIGTFFVSYL